MRRRCPVHQGIQDFAHTKIVNRRAKEHRCQFACQEFFQVKLIGSGLYQFDFSAQIVHFQWEQFIQARIVNALYHFEFMRQFFRTRFKQVNLIVQDVVHTFEIFAHADGPSHGRTANLQHAFNFIEQFQRVAHFPVVFVHEGHNRRIAHATHVQQFDGLRFHTLGRINHHQSAVYRR